MGAVRVAAMPWDARKRSASASDLPELARGDGEGEPAEEDQEAGADGHVEAQALEVAVAAPLADEVVEEGEGNGAEGDEPIEVGEGVLDAAGIGPDGEGDDGGWR